MLQDEVHDTAVLLLDVVNILQILPQFDRRSLEFRKLVCV